MAIITDEAVEAAKKFLRLLRDANINVERAILFGSHVRGIGRKWSDIDIAIVSPDFSGIRFSDSKMMVPLVLRSDTRIEVHPFRAEDFTEEDAFVKEIIKTGLELKV
ncbi:MAG: nucleotidyltransferase domain-containing protein [Thermodesulfovibrionales bacterium]